MRAIIFDLSEVLIAGLIGIETSLAERFGMDPEAVLRAFGGTHLDELLHGRSSEEEYLQSVLGVHGWDAGAAELKELIRANFRRRVEGMDEIVEALAERFDLVLLSDHGTEWVNFIRSIHPFLGQFSHQFYSCELGCTKRSPEAFLAVLRELGGTPGDYLFIDDNPGNVEVARGVGLDGIRFTGAESLRDELDRRGITLSR
ncbi:MAG TPA: HAD family phosphatase [Trueperaceae bacterium]